MICPSMAANGCDRCGTCALVPSVKVSLAVDLKLKSGQQLSL